MLPSSARRTSQNRYSSTNNKSMSEEELMKLAAEAANILA